MTVLFKRGVWFVQRQPGPHAPDDVPWQSLHRQRLHCQNSEAGSWVDASLKGAEDNSTISGNMFPVIHCWLPRFTAHIASCYLKQASISAEVKI